MARLVPAIDLFQGDGVNCEYVLTHHPALRDDAIFMAGEYTPTDQGRRIDKDIRPDAYTVNPTGELTFHVPPVGYFMVLYEWILEPSANE